MHVIKESVEVNSPVDTVYSQWMQFKEFPSFMAGVKEVQQIDDKHLHWRADIAGKEKEWDTEVTEAIPNRKICWQSVTGSFNAGSVRFFAIDGERTKITLRMRYAPCGLAENIGDLIGAVSARLSGDLQRFKVSVESNGKAVLETTKPIMTE